MRFFQTITILAVVIGIVVSVTSLWIQYNYYTLRKKEFEKIEQS